MENHRHGYSYRGKVATISVKNRSELNVTFEWLEEADSDGNWRKRSLFEYTATLQVFSVSRIYPDGNEIGAEELCISSSVTGEVVFLYPPGVANLDYADDERIRPAK